MGRGGTVTDAGVPLRTGSLIARRVAQRSAVAGWVSRLADHHPYTARHSAHVAVLTDLLCQELGVAAEQRVLMRRCALLHDVGKLAVPVELLNGATRDLDDTQRAMLRAHSAEGERRVAGTPQLADLAPVIRAVHERWDGTGYPDMLAGEQIPFAARALAICDAYDAMTSPERLYAVPMDRGQALACLQENAGSQFDPRLVRRFIAMMDRVGDRAAASWPAALR